MYKEPRALQEIHQIQERIYEREKKMTPVEQKEALHRELESARKRFHIKTIKVSSLFAIEQLAGE